MMYYANMQEKNQRKTGYIIGKNASSDSRHLLLTFPERTVKTVLSGIFLVFGRKWKLRKSLSFPWLNITKHQI